MPEINSCNHDNLAIAELYQGDAYIYQWSNGTYTGHTNVMGEVVSINITCSSCGLDETYSGDLPAWVQHRLAYATRQETQRMSEAVERETSSIRRSRYRLDSMAQAARELRSIASNSIGPSTFGKLKAIAERLEQHS